MKEKYISVDHLMKLSGEVDTWIRHRPKMTFGGSERIFYIGQLNKELIISIEKERQGLQSKTYGITIYANGFLELDSAIYIKSFHSEDLGSPMAEKYRHLNRLYREAESYDEEIYDKQKEQSTNSLLNLIISKTSHSK